MNEDLFELHAQMNNGTTNHIDNTFEPGLDVVPYEEGDTINIITERYRQHLIDTNDDNIDDKLLSVKGAWVITKQTIGIINNALKNKRNSNEKGDLQTKHNAWQAIKLHAKKTL